MKTKAFLPATILLIASLTGCNSYAPQKSMQANDGSVRIVEKPDGPLYICDLATVKDTIEVPLSELIEDCRLIRFETSDPAMFKAWWIYASDNYIGIRQEEAPFKLYDKEGKYLGDIGTTGNGPGEYTYVYDEIIDEKSGQIFFTPFVGDKILVYGMDGKWIKDIKLPGKINKAKIQMNEDGTLSVVHMPFNEGDPFAFRIDTDGNVLEQVHATDDKLTKSFDNEIFSYRNTGTFDFFYTGVDTTYQYDASANRLIPRFTMTFPNPEKKPYHIHVELPNHVMTNCFYWDNGRVEDAGIVLVDKQKMASAYFHLVNDFYGNLPIESPNTKFNKGWFFHNVEPGALSEMIATHLASGKCPPEAKAQLEELAATLHENDNNLMFLGKLKR